MYFCDTPPCEENQIIIRNEINARTLQRSCEELFFHGFFKHYGEFNEEHFLSMIRCIYGDPITNLKCILPDAETAEKELREAKASLLRKTEKSMEMLGKQKEKTRKRIIRFLSIIEDPKFEKHKALISEIVGIIDAEF